MPVWDMGRLGAPGGESGLMKGSRIARIVFFLTVFAIAWQPLALAQSVDTNAYEEGTLLAYLQDDTGTIVPGACFVVIDAEGGIHELCDSAGAGTVSFTGLPMGEATVSASSVPTGYQPAEAQSALILEGHLVTAVLIAPAIPPTPMPTVEPPVNPAPEAPVDNGGTDHQEPTVEAPQSRSLEVGIMALPGSPTVDCSPRGQFVGGDVFLTLPTQDPVGQPLDADPTVEWSGVDRFGTSYSGSGTMSWVDGRYIYSLEDTSIVSIDFVIEAGLDSPIYIGGDCQVVNPIPMGINTSAGTEAGVAIPNGGQIPSGTAFRDTAWFVNPNDEWDFKSELVGQEVTYYLYQGSECTGTPVFSDTVTVLEGGVIPDSDLYQPLEDGIYNWQVVYGGEGEDGNFLPAHSI